MSGPVRRGASVVVLTSAALVTACADDNGTDPGRDGTSGTGGNVTANGGSPSGTGGAVQTGGTPGAAGSTGGSTPTGGSGGAPTTGGMGGAPMGGVSGMPSGGGGMATGGMATGGTPPANGGTDSGGSGGMSGGTAGGGGIGNVGKAGAAGDGGGAGEGGSGGKAEGGASGGGVGGSAGDGGMAGAGGSDDDSKSAGCGKPRTLMNGRRTIQVNGMNREYILRVPDNYDQNRPYRLVMAYHWLNGSANDVANGGGSTERPFYGLWDLANGSTIFVAPEGLNAGWANNGDRDIAFTDAMLETILGDLCIDKKRIFATGFSYGAGMSYALACSRANVFRAVALYAGAQLSGCNGGNTPIAYFAAHGIRDSVLDIKQGRMLRDRFVMVNGCTQQNPPEPSEDSGTHQCTSYQGCKEGYPVRWCAFDGDHNPTEKDRGQNESWVPREAWEFLSQF